MASYASSTTSAVPPTLLPADPKSLSRYLRSQQLSALRHLYEYKTLAVTQQIEEHAASMRGRHGRIRRRRGSSPLLDERDLEAEEEEDELEVRKKMRYDPSDDEDEAQPNDGNEEGGAEGMPGVPSSHGTPALEKGKDESRKRRRQEAQPIDPAHCYDLVFDLSPDWSADAYYHGPHPPPPARVVHAVLRATRKKPFIDPEGLSAAQLESLAAPLWETEGKGLSIFFGEEGGKKKAEHLSRDQERAQREVNMDAAEDWELAVIAGFSATCDERIGRSLARKPMTAREMQAQVQLQAAQAAQQAQQVQQQQATPQQAQQQHPTANRAIGQAGPAPQPHVGALPGYGLPPQVSPYGDRERYAGHPADPNWHLTPHSSLTVRLLFHAMLSSAAPNERPHMRFLTVPLLDSLGKRKPFYSRFELSPSAILNVRKRTFEDSSKVSSSPTSHRSFARAPMPTVTVDRVEFFRRLGREYTTKEFDELLFQYGLELDEDTTTDPDHPAGEPHQLKIEVPANRYDLLCIEGIARALKLYLSPDSGVPTYALKHAPAGEARTVRVKAETSQIRPYFASAILRNVKFDKLNYASFIDLQDKLHQNLARRRTLVAIGTHDLDKIAPGDITYEALPPKEIKFAPLNKTQEYTAEEMMALYKEDKHLSRYLHIIEDSPVYPIIYDSSRQVLSMPPIINSDRTKITLDTKNVFIDVTATDQTKLDIVVDMIVTMFSEYCSEPFIIEAVNIVYEQGCTGGPRTILSPPLTSRPFVARASYINSCTGLNLSRDEIIVQLRKMGHAANTPDNHPNFSPLNAQASLQIAPEDEIHVYVPPTRPDILHECDIMEEVAIAYGFDNLKKTFPRTNTVAKPFPINKLSDILRRLCSEASWTEVLPLILCSHDENFEFLNRKDPGDLAVVLANPKTIEYQIVRTSLLPGMLKSVRENRKHTLPLRIFEVSDVVVKDPQEERQARNVRRLGAVFCGRKAGFEVVHGLLDRLMLGLGIKNLVTESSSGEAGYYIKASEDATYFPGRSADIYYRPGTAGEVHAVLAPTASTHLEDAQAAPASTPPQAPTSTLAPSQPAKKVEQDDSAKKGALDTIKDALASALPSVATKAASKTTVRDIKIGSLGILHPSVLKAYELDYPCSSLEFDVEPFL
ncbi:Phenylalanyl-tRNA synthetase subunit beta [Rhodotorula toruloides ATCC 204091]|nr:Phenylalanyl-tRNA synthetase subunit beta [Rhodotorula toruloides ATCC 204091]